MNSPLRRYRRLPLRSRLALLVATAVALAVAAASVTCWFVTREALVNSLDNALSNSRMNDGDVVRQIEIDTQAGQARCLRQLPKRDATSGVDRTTVQVVTRTGEQCVIYGRQSVAVGPEDYAVAAGQTTESSHDALASTGEKYRVYTYQLKAYPHLQLAVSVSRPLSEVNDPLDDLALILLIVAGVGVLLAGGAGLWVARSGLRPVDRLTDAVEHVARTEDLSLRIPVEGDDEIARLSASFNAMTAALASSRDLQAQLIADAGHELRTPLTSLRTNIELLARSEDTGRPIPPDDRKALLASVKAQMTELASLITDLQELARPESTPGHASPKVVGWHDLMRTALERARLRGPELTFDVELAPWYVRAEPPVLERALVNILDNAVKFSPPSGTISVRLHLGELTVRDHGPGIPPADLPHVFERFWRSPSARALPGSGLGLSIVARAIREAGGEVALRAPLDGGPGTEAVVRLPGAPTPPPSEVP
ncbi:two-component sensor histidine kinase [Streptomyces spiroverticillatus]|uniref:histidine kinase n=1 Tax=Streptomyces finlayi TaxID=67296 RepID=A0A918WTV2_9ACTN|nr:HAMP domain-containing sensor histidine kinase [Streptomyces finlayi]GGZ97308.1 two-component sensor histidine kinase [Streptomyces spiroverticillatus]GHC82469.1 two-component sensor histidine kinase [Streptomyces finlayi]